MLIIIFMTSSYRKNRNDDRFSLKTRLLNIIFFFFTLIIIFFSSCKKDPVKIGLDLLPDQDFVNLYSTDTIGVKAYTMFDEMSHSADSTTMIAGNIYDEYFGSTHCDFVTQLRLITPWPYYTFEIDSVFLFFQPSSVSGDTAAVHHIRLYETGTTLYDSIDYYSTQVPDTITFLGEYDMPVLKADSSYSVRLDNWVGEYFLRDTAMFLPAAEFYTTFFKGLYFGIRSETNPVIITMTAADNPLAITIYYHDPDNIDYTYTFLATERAVNYNRFIHDFSTADPEKRIKHINDFVADTAVFQQSYNGVYARFDIQSLASFRDLDRIAVNKARLFVPVFLDGQTYTESNLSQVSQQRKQNIRCT
jgi:hypothetical protein